jgi:hypothetical protein
VILEILHWAAILFVVVVVWSVISLPCGVFVAAVISLGEREVVED